MSSKFDISRRTAATTLAAIGVAVVVASRAYLADGQAPYGDDNSAHFGLMMHIADLWRSGITDLWWDQSNLGLPLFMAYQPLPALVTGSGAALFADTAPRLFLYKATIVGMWAAMPAAWYIGGRWMGLDRKRALLLGLLTLAVHDLHDVGFAFSAVTYGGLYTQMWGMFFFPMTVGAFRRYVIARDLRLIVPVGLFVVLSMSHLFCGMFAGIATALWAVAARDDRVGQLKRAALVYGVALALLAFWLGPLVATGELVGGLPWKNEYYNGWPAVSLFDHLTGGDVLDSGRLPWLTVLAAAGLFTVVRRRLGDADGSEDARQFHNFDTWLLGLAAVSVVMLMGRTNFGEWYDLVPMHSDVNVMRYLNAVQFCGLLFAALAGGTLLEWAYHRVRKPDTDGRVALLAVAAIVAAAGWYTVDRADAFEDTLKTFDHRHANVAPVIDHLGDEPSRRFGVADELNTGPHFFRDLFPTLADRGQLQSYALGYHATLSTYYADYIQFDEPAWHRLFNVGAYLAREPFDKKVVEGFTQSFEQGPYRVYQPVEQPEWGYFDFVRTPLTVHGDYRAIRPGVRSILAGAFDRRVLPVLEGPTEASERADTPLLRTADQQEARWRGPDDSSWSRLVANRVSDAPIRSTVEQTSRGPNWYQAQVDAHGQPERLLLKVNYFPFWEATIDGESVAIDHVAPNFMAVDVPDGRHTVRFSYHNPWWQKVGAVLTLLILVFWTVGVSTDEQ